MNKKNVLPCAGGGGSLLTAFTMAEILLSLTIIGVVAAITLPSLTGNINERTWNTQRKALYARFSQAIALMPALNGYGTLTEDENGSITVDTAAETFVTAGLSKVLKINNICDHEHLQDCGIPSKIIALNGSTINIFPKSFVELNSIFNDSNYSQADTKVTAFETSNGESIVAYYNPNCLVKEVNANERHYVQGDICANFIYDLNGSKGPNTMGKDIGFITALYSTDTIVVAPIPISNTVGDYTAVAQDNAAEICLKFDSQSRLPNMAEAIAIIVNNKLLNLRPTSYWTSTVEYRASLGVRAWDYNSATGVLNFSLRTWEKPVRCIRR